MVNLQELVQAKAHFLTKMAKPAGCAVNFRVNRIVKMTVLAKLLTVFGIIKIMIQH